MRSSTLRFVLAYLRLNLSAAVEYRAAFLAQALGMMLNDLVFIIFWGLYFARFPNVGGWGMQDVALLWAVLRHRRQGRKGLSEDEPLE